VNISSKMTSLWQKLRNKKFRDAFVASQFKRSIPFQITAIRRKLGWSQEQLAKAAKLTQGVISRAENPDYGNLTFNSVLRIAAGLDVAVVIEFVPFSRLLKIFESRSEDFESQTFEQEDKILSDNGVQGNHTITPLTGSLDIVLDDVTLKSQIATTENIMEASKQRISPAEKAARGISDRKPSSAEESVQERRQAA
jgi:transcriptional regulator with XRE-family HTH domain